ncbi:MAG TPA: lysophospholipid acyltransferase family protein [Actinomycetota bacterium]
MARRGDLNGWWRFGIAVVGAVARVCFRVRVEGVDRVPRSGPAVVAANHVSALDGVLLALVVGQRCRRMTRFLTAAEFFAKKRFGWALRLYRQIPLRRGEGDVGALDEAIRTVRSGALAGVFPEGRVNPSPEDGLQRGRTGLARVALASGAAVVPVGIWGTNDRWPKAGLRFGRPWRPVATLCFGEPVTLEGDAASTVDTQRFVDVLMARIAERVEDARRLAAS